MSELFASQSYLSQPTDSPHPLSVSALLAQMQDILSQHFSTEIKVKGELSSINASPTGHWYFSIKDSDAQLQCVMFKNNNRTLLQQPKDGEMLVLTGTPAFYKGRGQFQFVVSDLIKEGEGKLQIEFEKIKQKLYKEGLFDVKHKKELPSIIQHLCIITSPRAAALQDVTKVLTRRMPMMKLYLAATLVQGEDAPQQIIKMLQLANKIDKFDAVLITRGGGSAEDISCFNDENLIRAIFKSKIPVVSAVGHEIDFTLCDMVADHRSPTPSAAAEEISIDSAEELISLAQSKKKIRYHLENRMRNHIQQTDDLWQRAHRCNPIELCLAELQAHKKNLGHYILAYLNDLRHYLAHYHSYFAENNPYLVYSEQLSQLGGAKLRLSRAMQNMLSVRKSLLTNQYSDLMSSERRHLESLTADLHHKTSVLSALNPKGILKRGYSLVRDIEGSLVSDASTLHGGDILEVQLAKGEISTKVVKVNPLSDAVT